jgi:ppGpp synthetase/RelA/SpoT-type nucleotidyltranferase
LNALAFPLTRSATPVECEPRTAKADFWLANAAFWDRSLDTAAEKRLFPGGSKERVNRAGDAVRNGTATPDDLAVIDAWRAAHRSVLNTFQSILRNRTRHTEVVVAQRHKRKTTIFGKLTRYPKMQLSRMDDVAGCRLIFPSIDALTAFRAKMHAAKFAHTLKNEPDKYDYMAHPKDTGYRGIHDVYSYDVNSVHGRHHKGLLIELQYRTFYQHAWATAVEVVGFITESQPKFQQGDRRYEYALSLASEIIARSFEDGVSCHAELSDQELVDKFLEVDEELGLMRMLRALNSSKSEVSGKRNVILIFGEEGDGDPEDRSPTLETRSYRDATEALRALFVLEVENPHLDVVLVRASSSEDVRNAFRNYFSDATEFIRLIDDGCEKLAGKYIIHDDPHDVLGQE